jgi:hypothetical protein
MTVYCVWFICIYWLVYLFYVFFLKWSDKRILCDLLVLMITTLWLCFPMMIIWYGIIWHVAVQWDILGSSLDWSRSSRTADLDTRGVIWSAKSRTSEQTREYKHGSWSGT